MVFPAEQVLIAVRIAHGLSVAGLIMLISRPREPLKKGFATLLDLSLLWMMVLALSPQLQPHHEVLLLVPSFVFADRLLDRQEHRSIRIIAIILMVAAPLAMELAPSGIARGTTLHVILACYAIGIG